MEFWGLVCKRYPDPKFTLDAVISNGRFLAFINNMLEEIEHEKIYDVWLHRVFDKSLNDFKRQVTASAEAATQTTVQTAQVVRASFDILSNFDPEN